MSDAITRCPKCGTSFRITEAHLNSAKGAVRCGSCLNIFNAKQNLVKETPNLNKTAQEQQANKLSKKPAEQPIPPTSPLSSEDEDDDILISDDMEPDSSNQKDDNEDYYGVGEDTQTRRDAMYSSTIPNKESNLFEREIIQAEKEEDVRSDESWALNLLKNLDDDNEQTTLFKNSDTSPLPEKKKERPSTPSKRIPPKSPEPEDSPHDAPLTDLFESRRSENNTHTSPFQIIEEPEDEPNAFESRRKEPSLQNYEDDIDEEINEDAYPASGRYYDQNPKNAFINAIEPEPVEFAYKKHPPFWRSKWVWRIGSVVAALLICIEVAWLQFANLSRVQPYRQYYATACTIIGCRLPPLLDRSKIRAANLVVRTHPSIDGALIVDAVIQNTAHFAQTFPDLDLIFTDLKNSPVAARRFAPQEYLGGELAGTKDMPAGQPIHIAIEIKDPGTSAVSYRIAIAN